ncbi:MAG: twin-arginine translocase TatA/TatE family subunit [Candidatus Methanoperedens sp.]|jgi:sec-independent protein translocase protein TatA|nr:twin-arginine translocase TatA/TatE family subunit [Candidatus Methanoperedens sp.]PKL54586.1 MAG: twin-arginine translocase TatA/TatE family subunit [Candidatus Methanoperedenaceae archaeon HGW-Methanoperedenaceae-1]
MLGTQEIVLIFLAVIILFGASKIPELARSLGMATGEFKKAQQEAERELKDVEKSLKKGANRQEDSNKIKLMAKDFGIEPEGKSDEELLDEIKEKMKK